MNLICFGSFYLSSVFITELAPPLEVDQAGPSLLSNYLVFFIGFLARPLGALWFGVRGDLQSPRKAIRESALLMVFSTLLMGVLPQSPASDDLFFVILRCVQGIGLGGCYAAMAVYLYNGSPLGAQGRFTSWLQSSVPLGYVSALLGVLLLKMIFASEFYASGGWRIAFFMPFVALFFLAPLKDNRKYDTRFGDYGRWLQTSLSTLRQEWSHWAPYLILTLGIGVLAFTGSNFKFYFMKVILKMDPVVVDFASGVATVLYLPFYYFGGWLTDRFDKFTVSWLSVVAGAFLLLPSFYMFEWAAAASSFQMPKIILSVILISGVIVIAFGSLISLLCDLFPLKMRCTLFALTYSLTVGVTGGVAHGYGIDAFVRHQEKYAGLYVAVVIALLAALVSGVLRFRYLRKAPKPGVAA